MNTMREANVLDQNTTQSGYWDAWAAVTESGELVGAFLDEYDAKHAASTHERVANVACERVRVRVVKDGGVFACPNGCGERLKDQVEGKS